MTRISLALLLALGLSNAAAAAPASPVHVLVVQDAVTVTVHEDGSSSTERDQIFKALDAAGAQILGAVTIPFNGERQEVTLESASIVHAATDGAATPSDAISETLPMPTTEGLPAFAHAKRVVVRFPNPTPGSVVALRFKVEEAHSFLPGNFSFFHVDPRTASLQAVSYTVLAPASMHLNVHANGVTGRQESVGTTQKWTFSASQVPALINTASQSELLAKSPYIEINQVGPMEEVARQYLVRTRPAEHVSLELQHLADTVGQASVEPENLMVLYYAWINDHIRLVDVPLEMGARAPRKAEDILLSGYGSIEDRVILLQALMRAKAIPTDLVLVPSLPVTWGSVLASMPSFYNRLLLTVHNGQQALDIGNPVLAMGQFSPRDKNKLGFRIAPNGGVGPIQIPNQGVSQAVSAVSTRIDVDLAGALHGTAVVADYGDLATTTREDVATLSPLELRSRLTAHAPASTQLSIDSIDPPMVPSNQFLTRATFNTPGFLPSAGNVTMQVPRAVTSLAALDSFAQAQGAGLCQRTWRGEDTIIHVAAPHSMLPPRNVDIEADGGIGHYTATYAVDPDAGTLTVKRSVALRANDANCDHEQQAALARLAAAVRADLAAQVTLYR